MASVKATELAALVKVRFGGATSRRLIELTNNSGSATTVDDSVLEACCDDAIGDFRVQTGIEPETNPEVPTHTVALVAGVLYYLESYKGRDASMEQNHARNFFSKLKRLESKKYVLAQSTSKLEQSEEKQGTRPDMDRSRSAFRGGRTLSQISEISED